MSALGGKADIAKPRLNVRREPDVLRSGMFSATLERRRRINRWALTVAATLLAIGIPLIVIWAVRAYDMLGTVGANRMPIVFSVLVAIAGLLILCLVAYAAIRAYGRFTEAR